MGVLSCYICICSCIASITMLHLYLQLYRHCTCCSMKTCCLLNLLLLLLLLLLILYIDFQQLHSRHRQTYIFCHCFKQSEYSTADECIESHPTYMAGRLCKRVTDRVSRKSTSGLCRKYLLYIRDTCNILWTGI